MATKVMNIYSYNLKKDTTVMLMFDPPHNTKLFREQFPVVWKVITFRAGGHGKCTVTYVARLAFGYVQIDANNFVGSAAWTEVKSGDTTSLSGGYDLKRFGDVTKGMGTKHLSCKNNSPSRSDLSIGFVKGDGIDQRYEPTLVWTGIGARSYITAQFTPILKAYMTRDYQATEILRGEVETEAIWECNINEIDDVTGWNFIENDASGCFSIEPANSV